MLKYFRRGATFIQGGTSIPESRVVFYAFLVVRIYQYLADFENIYKIFSKFENIY